MRLALKSLQLSASGGCVGTCSAVDADNPNKLPFKGTLLLVNQPSTKPPHGSRGHRILVPKDVANKRLAGLIGTGVNYDAQDLDEHMPRRKVGVITGAKIVGNKVVVNGHIFAKDFPEAVSDLKRNDLGMSMELADVLVRDADEDVWYLKDFQFTGASILKKNAAAYTQTSLAAKAAAEEDEQMATPIKKKQVAAAAENGTQPDVATIVAAAVEQAVGKVVSPLQDSITQLTNRVDDLASAQQITAGAEDNDEELEEVDAASEEEEEMDAAHEDDEDMDAKGDNADESSDDDGSDDDASLDAELEKLEEKPAHAEPGQVNKGMKTKGSKTTTTDVGANAAGGRKGGLVHAAGSLSLQAAAMRIGGLERKNQKLVTMVRNISAAAKKSQKQLKTKIATLEAQMERFADTEGRRSVVPVELNNLLAKQNISVSDLQASGQKVPTEVIDAAFDRSGIQLDPEQRIAFKSLLVRAGVMDEGVVDRGYRV